MTSSVIPPPMLICSTTELDRVPMNFAVKDRAHDLWLRVPGGWFNTHLCRAGGRTVLWPADELLRLRGPLTLRTAQPDKRGANQ